MLNKLFPNDIYSFYFNSLNFHLKDCQTVLDVACGRSSPLANCEKNFTSTGLDIFEPYLKESMAKGIHDDYIVSDVLSIDKAVKSKSFDAVIALDLIEHLEKEKGFELISLLENIAIKKVIFFTPNGFLKQEPYDDNPWQEHLSGWTVEEFKDRDYEVFGQGGLKYLRGEMAKIRFQPRFFWSRISYFSQKILQSYPKSCFQLLCVKSL